MVGSSRNGLQSSDVRINNRAEEQDRDRGKSDSQLDRGQRTMGQAAGQRQKERDRKQETKMHGKRRTGSWRTDRARKKEG